MCNCVRERQTVCEIEKLCECVCERERRCVRETGCACVQPPSSDPLLSSCHTYLPAPTVLSPPSITNLRRAGIADNTRWSRRVCHRGRWGLGRVRELTPLLPFRLPYPDTLIGVASARASEWVGCVYGRRGGKGRECASQSSKEQPKPLHNLKSWRQLQSRDGCSMADPRVEGIFLNKNKKKMKRMFTI